ncbi:hypothetical protein RN001_010376 [Aquatica leii]|uniref:Cytosolic fatty-acid binding proteins domain-containing protein n=1 Tax=Aquatica leii TaxID=1421715 RepID=A0AAN7P0V5_9COLE|nr:hypothetical protein RN001_010376 [Aquatica leii]
MANVDDFLGKKYVLSTSENFDAYLKAMGVNALLRRLATTLSPVIELTKSGDEYTYKSTTTFSKTVASFKLGVEFEKSVPGGDIMKSVMTIDGCTLTEVQIDGAGRVTTIERRFSTDEIKAVIKYNDITAINIYKAKS